MASGLREEKYLKIRCSKGGLVEFITLPGDGIKRDPDMD